MPRPVSVISAASLALLLSGVLGATVAPVAPGMTGTTSSTAVPAAGGAVCVTGAGPSSVDADLLLLAAPGTPPSEDAAARGRVTTYGTGPDLAAGAPPIEIAALASGRTARTGVTLGPDGWLWVGWADRPLLAWQEWSTPGSPGQPGGTIASACLPVDPPVQTVLGLSTIGGDEALLRLANPFAADATFAVTLITPTEVLEPVALRNVSVRGGTRTTLRLNDHAPEQGDLAAIVTVGAGRLVVEGLQRSVAAVGGVDGLASVPPVAAPSVAWTVPWLPSGPDIEGVAWILNPSPRDVVIEVTVHTPEGASVPADTASIEVGPGELRRVAIAELAADDRSALALTLRSQTTDVLVAAGARFRADEPARTGLVHVAASPLPDAAWAVAGVAAPDRRTVLHIVNLSEAEVAPSITLTTLPEPAVQEDVVPDDGTAVGEGDGGPDDQLPDDQLPEGAATSVVTPDPVTVVLAPAPVAAGAVGRIVLPLEGAGAWSAIVSGGTDLVVSRTTLGDEQLGPVALAATPSRWWRAVPVDRAGRPIPGWVAGLGTARDLRRSDPMARTATMSDIG